MHHNYIIYEQVKQKTKQQERFYKHCYKLVKLNKLVK